MRKPKRGRYRFPRKSARHAIPHAEVVNSYYTHTTPTIGPFTHDVTARERTFTCPSSIILGNRRDPNPWYFKKFGVTHPSGKMEFYWLPNWAGPGGFDRYEGQSFGPYFNYDNYWFQVAQDHSRVSDPDYDVETYNKALARLYDDIRKTDLNALLSTYELRELGRLRKQMTTSLRTFTRTFRSLVPSASLLAAGGWLTYSYVVKPMLNDVSELLKFTALLTDDFYVKGSASVTSGGQERVGSTQCLVTSSATIKTKIKMAIAIEDAADFDAWRLGFRSPASFLYESVPFSFVLDWVWNMGQYYSSLEASYGHGFRIKSGFKTSTATSTQITEWDKSFSYNSFGTTKYWTGYAHGNSYFRRSERTLLTHLPSPRVPTLDLDLASSQLLSAAALLRTLGFNGR